MQTLAMIKPDAVASRDVGQILTRLELRRYRIVGMQMLTMSRDLAEEFYAEHKGKPFFEGHIEFMTSGPCVAVVTERLNAVEALRSLVGATVPAEAAPGSIRAQFGTDLPRNAIHASDSQESAAREIDLIFGEYPIPERV